MCVEFNRPYRSAGTSTYFQCHLFSDSLICTCFIWNWFFLRNIYFTAIFYPSLSILVPHSLPPIMPLSSSLLFGVLWRRFPSICFSSCHFNHCVLLKGNVCGQHAVYISLIALWELFNQVEQFKLSNGSARLVQLITNRIHIVLDINT